MLDATTVASLAILLSSVKVSQMPKMPVLEVRVMFTKAVGIKTMVMAIVEVMGKLLVEPIL